MIYPNKLNKDDLITIISPSDGIIKPKKINELDKAIQYLEKEGYIVEEDKYVRNSEKGASSIAIRRAEELNRAISNKKAKALIACSGGDYLIQILDFVDFSKIKKNIKWVQGHSDITPLLYILTTKYDIATIYSFNVKAFGQLDLPDEMLQNDINILKNTSIVQKEYGYKLDEIKKDSSWECITKFKSVNGRIIGGCLDSLKDLVGTKYDKTKKFINKYKDDGIIWFFDVAEMTNEDILRTMWQFKQLGWFDYTKAILFGRLYEEKQYTGMNLEEVLLSTLKDLNIPIIINVDIGHTDPKITIVNGSIVTITNKEKYEVKVEFK